MYVLGLDVADIQVGSGLLAVDEGNLVYIQIPVRAVGDLHLGQEAAVIDGDFAVGVFGLYAAVSAVVHS